MTKEEEDRQKRRSKEDIRYVLKKIRKKAKNEVVKFIDVAVEMKSDLGKYQWIKNLKLGKAGDLVALIEETDLESMALDFEIEVVEFMRDVGFTDVIGTTKDDTLTFDAKEGGKVKKGGIQIDAMGLIGNRLFVVDAKVTKNSNGVYGGSPKALTNEINNHAGSGTRTRLKKLTKEIDAVRDGSPTTKENKNALEPYAAIWDLKYYGVMALHQGIQPSPTQKKMLYDHETNQSAKIFNWDEKFLSYYGSLSDNIGEYAKYDMLGEMGFSDEGEEEIAFCLEAEIEIKEHGKIRKVKTYQFVMDPKKLLKIATVARRHRPGEQFYQRQIDGGRLEDIAEFLEEGKPIPNNVIIGMTKKVAKEANFVPIKLEYQGRPNAEEKDGLQRLKNEVKKSTIPIRLGTLTFPRKYRSCWIIDGQHRLYGIIKTDRSDKPILKRNVKMAIVVFAGIDQDTMADMFLTINDKQKKIPAELKYDLYAEYLKEEPQGVLSRIVKELNKGESVLKKRIFYPSYRQDEKETPDDVPKEERISISAFYDAIRRPRLTQDVIVNKNVSKKIREQNNPLFRRIGKKTLPAHNKTVVKSVTKLIEDWYDILANEYPQYSLESSDPHKGMIFQQQVCKLWVPFLREIVVEGDKTPTKPTLKRYAKALKPFMATCIANEAIARSHQNAAAHYGTASDVLREMVEKVRSNSDAKLQVPTFGDKTKLLDPENKTWAKLENKFGRYIQVYHKQEWKKKLTKSRRDFIIRTARRAKQQDYRCLEMIDMRDILVEDPTNLKKLAKRFSKTPNYETNKPSSLEEGLQLGIRSIAEEFEDTRQHNKRWKPGPSGENSKKIEHYTTALTQALGASADDDDDNDN